MVRSVPFFARFLVGVVSAICVVLLGRGGVAEATTFAPTRTMTLSTPIGGAVADATYTFSFPAANSHFSLIRTMVPSTAFIAPGPGNPGFIGGTHPALNDVVGTFETLSISSLGLVNGACNNDVPFGITLRNATVDNSALNLVKASTQVDATPGSGTGGGILDPFDGDPPPASGAGSPGPGSTLGLANGVAEHIERYPAYLQAFFDRDFSRHGADGVLFTGDDTNGAAPPVQPLARYAGSTVIANSTYVVQVVVFSPGAFAAFGPLHQLFPLKAAGFGYQMVILINDVVDPASPTAITDTCTAEKLKLVLNGTVGGLTRYLNPFPGGTKFYWVYIQSLRDKDNDGYENELDTCPSAINLDASPRSSAGADGDMLDGVCDPTPAVDSSAMNHDADLAANFNPWLNAGDNCPLVVNPNNFDTEIPAFGPWKDGIGDACDSNPTLPNGHWHAYINLGAIVIVNSPGDTDDDGFADADETGFGSDPGNAASTPESYSLFEPMPVDHSDAGGTTDSPGLAKNPLSLSNAGEPYQLCNDGIDNDLDGLVDLLDAASGSGTCRPAALPAHPGYPTCPATGCDADSDGDGYTDEAEVNIGTDAFGRCEVGAVPSRSTRWPSDLLSAGVPSSTDKVNILDLSSFLAPLRRLDTLPGSANFDPRWDLVPGPSFGSNWIHVADLAALISGVIGNPPMSSGTKVFGSAFVRTVHPDFGD